MRLVDMVPAVRQALLALPPRAHGGLVFPGSDGGMFNRSNMRAWHRNLKKTQLRPIRPYDLRHTFASLLITAGKNALYIARQMGHYSAGFTLDTYGHLMEALSRCQVEWIDELVFPEGWEAALKLHLEGAPEGTSGCSQVQSTQAPEPLENKDESNLVQSGATGFMVGARELHLPEAGAGPSDSIASTCRPCSPGRRKQHKPYRGHTFPSTHQAGVHHDKR